MDRMKERCFRQSEQHMQKPRDGREHSGCSKQFKAAVCSMENEGEREEKCSSRRKQGLLVVQLCLTLYDSVNCSPPGSSVHGILQARVGGR